MADPLNLPSDFALDFANNMPDDSPDADIPDSEDPVGRGASRVGQLDMFVTPPPPPLRRRSPTRGAFRGPIPFIRMTPGAHNIP